MQKWRETEKSRFVSNSKWSTDRPPPRHRPPKGNEFELPSHPGLEASLGQTKYLQQKLSIGVGPGH